MVSPQRDPFREGASGASDAGFFAAFRRTESRKADAHWATGKEKAQTRDLGRPAVSN